MGCDGGTIPKRDELVRTKKKPEQKDKKSEVAFRWKSCALSQEPLQPPIVACELGRMYNKDAILEELLDTTKPNTDVIAHLKSIRDVRDLNLTENPAWNEEETIEKGVGYIDNQKSKWICPVIGQEMSGRLRFVVIWTCGCVLSERAIKQIAGAKASDQLECLKCQKPFTMDDVILINPLEEEEVQQAKERMEARRERARNAKKSKKQKAKASSTIIKVEDDNNGSEASSSSSDKNGTNGNVEDSSKPGKLVVPGKRSEKSKQIEESGEAGPSSSKKSRLNNDKPKSLETSSSNKLKGSYSVAADPSASETYKSLFTTHAKAKNQTKAHWVTFNPFYN